MSSRSVQEELAAYLSRVRIMEDPIDGRALIDARSEMEKYVRHHALSSALSLQMLRPHLPLDRTARVLEIGGAPYYFTALIHREFSVAVTAINVQAGAWPGEPAGLKQGRVVLEVPSDDGGERLDVDVRVANVERDAFPFASDSFDLVLCMEVLEHLGYSPSHMLAESHRVLRPGGRLFITVPNLVNIKRTVSVLLNRTSEVPYSGYGIYGRHQREFAPSEVAKLLQACNYRLLELQTSNVWPVYKGSRLRGIANRALNALTALPLAWTEAKREYILCLAEPIGEPLAAYPGWLYTHRHLYPDPPHGVRKAIGE